MEEDGKFLRSGVKPAEKLVQERLEHAVEVAQEHQDYEAAHNSEILRALQVVEQFLKRRGRVCYGGTAMNAILPKAKQFYNYDIELPDYDFFTPDLSTDIEELVADLRKEGFDDVYTKVGIHEGTKKVLVNFTAIADMTSLAKNLYEILKRRAIVKGGIHYTDQDSLRMMMYLELSRPKGQVERWEKVYERLRLINSVFPPKRPAMVRGGASTRKVRSGSSGKLPAETRRILLELCIENGRTLLTGSLDTFYAGAITGRAQLFPVRSIVGAIAWLTPDPLEDAELVQRALGGYPTVKRYVHIAKGEFMPEYVEVQVRGVAVAILVRETACHAFLHFQTDDGRNIQIASLDTLITLYYGIVLFTNQARQVLPGLAAALPRLIRINEQNRARKHLFIPAFPLKCAGYQKGYPTLLREKVVRIQEEKGAARASAESLGRGSGSRDRRKTKKKDRVAH